MRDVFRQWIDQQPLMATTKNTVSADLNRIERDYGDLDEAYDRDRFAAILSALTYSKDDERAGRANPSKFKIDGDLYANLAHYRGALSYYRRFRERAGLAAAQPLDMVALEKLRVAFLAHYPDFAERGFEADQGAYWDDERAFKEEVLASAREILASPEALPEEIGRRFLELLQRPPAYLIGWRTFADINAGGPEAERAIAQALGDMLTSNDEVTVIAETCAAAIHPLIMVGTQGKPAFGAVRTLVTTALALARPDEAIAVKTRFMQRWGRALTGRALLKTGVMTSTEFQEVLNFAQAIGEVMRGQWQWTPRDLWDVQGFLWAASENRAQAAADDEAETDVESPVMTGANTLTPPTNLILYGPPGTGKTYETASRAVTLCDGPLAATDGRQAVMTRYRDLVERKRIGFVTFHQSYAYEDFVEGLRPETGVNDSETASGGFSLRAQPGVFRQIADLARDNHGRAKSPAKLDRSRKVFKMSLGRSAEEEGARLFRESINGGYVVLGWGGEIDWSAPQFADFRAIRTRWQSDHPDATGNDPNVRQLWALRSGMEVGDLVVISDGNKKFRAIGEIAGPYEFVPGHLREYNHRRPVRWLWRNDQGRPRELIYGRGFSQISAYQLDAEQINWPALEQIVAGGGEGVETIGEAEAYVLIIDEINRANISKVFGELITLIEPDKRLGQENALTVTLPYSGDPFGVPANLHIIGTMNTADRSIALLDTALRRRFEFVELMPDPDGLAAASARTGLDLVAALTGLNARIEFLFDRDHQIGHGFFMACATRADVDRVMRTKVIPLLIEYFYENWEKVRQALGETADDGAFVSRTLLKPPAGAEDLAPSEGRWRYSVRSDFTVTAYDQLRL